ncbi:hypothetical protein F8S13_06025 [Chloroflexia bacterium SDU3-3]|nr:hypothetical protein F8S13_06025 [Chloroflexia bacterium SDU3-3]
MRQALALLATLLAGAALVVLAYQLPAAHAVDVGGADGAYVQGFYDPSRADAQPSPEYLAGSDGRARWSKDRSFLLFPQVGLPAELTLRLRAAPQAAPSATLDVLLGGTPLGTVVPTQEWAEYRFPIRGGLTKPTDVLIELRASATSAAGERDPRAVGVLLDRAALRTVGWPILPYPGQVALGALDAGLLWLLARGWRWQKRAMLAGAVALPLLFVLCCRAQPLWGYPLRPLLAWVALGLGAAALVRYTPALAGRFHALPDVAALATVAAWVAAVGLAAQGHVVLSRPGVESDFSVFANRSARLAGSFQPGGIYDASTDGVLRADGFYNIGYPLLLWLARPLAHGNAFLAARYLSLAAGAALLLATWWLGRSLAGRGGGLLATLAAALSPLVVEYGLYVGTDMVFAATCALALALLHAAGPGRRGWAWAGAGLLGGLAFSVRHPGVLLLPLGMLAITLACWRDWRAARLALLLFAGAFALASAPQVAINLRDTGSPLYSQQAKNIWLAAYAGGDWGRWYEVPNSIGMAEVALNDPARFLGNWITNIRSFLGAGGEDVSEFGRADQLRLLAFPANWLAVGALGAWLLGRGASRERRLALAWVAMSATFVSVGLALVRFALPLAPVYAAAAAAAALWLGQRIGAWAAPRMGWLTTARATAALGLALAALMWGGFAAGAGLVLGGQPDGELAAVSLIQRHVGAGQRVRVEADARALFDSYSAIAHLVARGDEQASFLLQPKSTAAQPNEQLVDSAGDFALYTIDP